MFVVRRWLYVACCFFVSWLLFRGVCCSLVVVRRALCGVGCLSFPVRCSLFGVC